MTGPIDWNGISVFLGALAAFITVVGGFVMQVLIFVRQGKALVASKELHASVNGQTAVLNETVKNLAFAKGEATGIASERADPQDSSNLHE